MAAAGLWLGVALMLAFALARIARPDTNLFLIWANAYTFWIYLPAYGVMAFAGVFRKFALLAAAAAVAVCHLAWVLPDYRPAEEISDEARAAPAITLMTVNVFFENPDYGPVIQEILDTDADVVFIQEIGLDLQAELVERGFEARYPHRYVEFENPYFGLATYSKLPFESVETREAGGRPYIRATINVEGTDLLLYNVHPTSPGLGKNSASMWNAGWRTLTAVLDAETGPVIVAGDFNMNQHHKWYRALKDDGYDSCHEERGRGNATTWPKHRKLRPIRIDQVFHSDGVVCLSVREGDGEGSDHRPVIAELAVLGN